MPPGSWWTSEAADRASTREAKLETLRRQKQLEAEAAGLRPEPMDVGYPEKVVSDGRLQQQDGEECSFEEARARAMHEYDPALAEFKAGTIRHYEAAMEKVATEKLSEAKLAEGGAAASAIVDQPELSQRLLQYATALKSEAVALKREGDMEGAMEKFSEAKHAEQEASTLQAMEAIPE